MQIIPKDLFLKQLRMRHGDIFEPEVEASVREIIDQVRRFGDTALAELTLKYDGCKFPENSFRLSKDDISNALGQIPAHLKETVSRVTKRIKRYQEKLIQGDWIESFGPVRLGALSRPLENVGVYIPGGSAPLISTVLMTVIPARLAGVRNIYVATPPDKNGCVNPNIIYACQSAGVSSIFKVGGAQAIAAMAFGTETIPRVDKIVGPGNIYVACAKRQLYGYVGIDMVAGPSEVLIIADDQSNARYIAADLLAQAEHDVRSRTFLVTTSRKIANQVRDELSRQLKNLSRNSIAQKSIDQCGCIVVVKNNEEAIEIANEVAPEHLEILVKNTGSMIRKIKNAGAIFVGAYSPEPVGDYVAGPSHVLPTGGTARFFSPLSVRDFFKSMSYIEYSRKALRIDLEDIATLTKIEGLDAHNASAKARFHSSDSGIFMPPIQKSRKGVHVREQRQVPE